MVIKEGKVLRAVLTELAKEGERYVPVGISARHIHLCQKDLEILFGKGYQLHAFRDLSQPGQFAASETVILEGPKGRIEKVRVLGPVRKKTQVEISLTDSMQLGIKNLPVRMSGNLDNTPGIKISGPNGTVELPSGTIAAARHIHMSVEEAAAYGLRDGQAVAVRVAGERPCVLENVICRTGEGHSLELHIDTDEANACGLKNGDILEVIECGINRAASDQKPDFKKISARSAAAVMNSVPPDESGVHEVLELVTQSDVLEALRNGLTCIYCSGKALITPSASDACKANGVELVRAELGLKKPVNVPRGADVLDLVTAQDLNRLVRDDEKVIYCTEKALITPAAKERISELGIDVIRI